MVRELMRSLRLLIALPLVLTMLGASAVWADPPTRVGRLSVIDGELALRRDGSQQWESASVNLPLTTGDELATESDSRAEIRIGSSVLRLAEDTSLEILRLDDERIRVRLHDGSVAMRVRSADPEAAIEVETRDGLAVPTEPGQYRIDYLDSLTRVSNYRGHVDFRGDGRDVSVSDGRRAEIPTDGRDEVRWDRPDDDDFSDWSLARDERDDRLGRQRYVSPEMTGAEDLYEHGDWREYDDYGPVWFPRSVPYGWAPYRYGRWVWVVPWGWTWVDDSPWGFAPFHYGRWVQIRSSWAWVPGRYIARPVYAPALVAWVGTPGVNISFSAGRFPDVSWFPLAPREVYVPRYRHSSTYVRQVNITHVTNVTEINRVVRAPDRVRHAFRDQRDAVTRVSDEVIRPPRFITRDPDRRRHRVQQLEGRPTVQRRDGGDAARPLFGQPESPRRAEESGSDWQRFRDDARRREAEREQGQERGRPVLQERMERTQREGRQRQEQEQQLQQEQGARQAVPERLERAQREGRQRQEQEQQLQQEQGRRQAVPERLERAQREGRQRQEQEQQLQQEQGRRQTVQERLERAQREAMQRQEQQQQQQAQEERKRSQLRALQERQQLDQRRELEQRNQRMQLDERRRQMEAQEQAQAQQRQQERAAREQQQQSRREPPREEREPRGQWEQMRKRAQQQQSDQPAQ
ncbi:DUF6600 domain-containing protein [Aromatoleum diolicum]|uniref:FecR protein domain-containing protein n=1 Tax=Aromatoleum diolicum TaxID=75796 RepID=A0ABX1QDU4_9RHOO|nr:DUF6600 domain-containing protein [Aromatoleum diolicum]NMG75359.1 hypothetical protein [Aromatoleum diolicum]